MATSAHHATLPSLTLRKLAIPAALWSVIAAALVLWKRHTCVPTVSPMSDEWLRSHVMSRGEEG